jgi:hypothetical protein
MTGPPAGLPQAAAILYRHRDRLSPDILRTIQAAWVCVPAAWHGGPSETGWVEDPDAYSRIDINAAVDRKLAVTCSRGCREIGDE